MQPNVVSRPALAAGFTLIELLVVLVLMGMLAGLVYPRIMIILDNGRHKSLKPKLVILQTSIDRYYLDTGRYPETLSEMTTRPSDANFWMGPYLEAEQMQDPWGHPVVYTYPGEHRDFDLIFFAKDGQPGGLDAAADVANYSSQDPLR